MTLTDFLLARIAEDETNAPQLQHFERWTIDSDVKPEIETFADADRVLAECEAKRRIVERCGDVGALMPSEHLARGVLALLALPYSDHPDYQPEWKP